MVKKLILGILLLFSLSFVVAHADYDDYIFKEKITETKYFPRVNRVETTTTYIDYENENRFPSYDYRHGYTYRSTKKYLENYKVKKYSKTYYRDNTRQKYPHHYNYKDYYYEYIPHMRNYEKKECYHRAPTDKLFYIKC